MVPPWASRGMASRPACARFGADQTPTAPAPPGPWLIIINALGLFDGAVPFPSRCVHAISDFAHSWPACSCSPRRPLPPTAASSSSPTRPTATASTSASPRARNAAPMPPAPIASHGNLLQATAYRRVDPDEITGSVPERRRELHAAPAAANTSPSPASAERRFVRGESRGGLPHRRPGNDVTLPREAVLDAALAATAALPRQSALCRADQLSMAGYA